MYENIKYPDLKDLPDDKKKEALIELRKKYGENKEVAKAIIGNALAVHNLYAKYVDNKPVGRVKGSKNSEKKIEVVIPIQSEVENKRKVKNNESREEVKPTVFTFTSKLSGELNGSEARDRINGLANSLIGDKTYTITISIVEK